ncbi:hypothetical protein [Fodinicurvata sp. EGI_FJ10296]|uniref:hypothetical protein n=1 Tax=Fodinicurvata sp. EGI_FJ10296 TaxID=3231908 RepID=UPI003451DDAA
MSKARRKGKGPTSRTRRRALARTMTPTQDRRSAGRHRAPGYDTHVTVRPMLDADGTPLPTTPDEWQQRHSPTRTVTIPAGEPHERQKTAKVRRRIADDKLWGQFTPEQMQAAEQILWCYNYLTRGVRTPSRAIEPHAVTTPGHNGAAAPMADWPLTPWELRWLDRYKAWRRECRWAGHTVQILAGDAPAAMGLITQTFKEWSSIVYTLNRG